MDGSYRDNQKMYGGGNKKQGLPPSIGFGRFSTNLIQRKAGYCKCVLSRGTNQPEPEPPLSVTVTFYDSSATVDTYTFTSDTAGYYRITGSAINYTFEANSSISISSADLFNKTLTIYSAAITLIQCIALNISVITFNYAPLLAVLECLGNTISNLDVSDLVNLTYLNCSFNFISILDVTNLVNLTNLICFDNLLDQFNAEAIATAIGTHPIYTGNLTIAAQKNGTTIDTTTSPFTALQTAQYSWTIYL